MTLSAIEKYGTTVEEAVSLALADLKCSEDEVTITIVEEPSNGFLGFGKKLARVRVEKAEGKAEKASVVTETKKETRTKQYGPIGKEEVTEEEARIDRTSPLPGKRDKKDGRKNDRKNGNRASKSELSPDIDIPETNYTADIHKKPENLVEFTETPALDFLRMLAEKMNLDVEIKAYKNDECIYMDISGKDAGTLIGKRGATLDSVQYLTSLVVNKEEEGYTKVIVDAENYREKREKTLEQLANRLAGKVLQTGKSVRLEPMNPYERKVIHATLQKYPGVDTRSEGEEPYRRVIIEREKKSK